MKVKSKSMFGFLVLVYLVMPACAQEKSWMMGPFERAENQKPIIEPQLETVFDDPMTERSVFWESMATFNPAAIIKDKTIHVFYRAEEKLGENEIGGHTSRLGLATSTDGVNYKRFSVPVFFPADDDQKEFEWTGGTEDPRIVVTDEGLYVLTYTQWNREYPRLAIATSKDLKNWTKHGPIFQNFKDGKYHNIETKSGAIVTQVKNGELVAAKIDEKYWMYYGVPHIWLAYSEDLINWTPVETHEGNLAPVLSPRPGYFDSWLVEAGPPPVLTEDGIVVLYNAGNSKEIGVEDLGNRVYTGGQALFSKDQPWKLLDRGKHPFIKPEKDFEKSGQYQDGTTFLEGLVLFNDVWYLYYGTADSMVGVVTWKQKP
ncbi:glycoside hydrolase family 130 protein [Belliella kenyensis]|uniref:Glycoside hydrolase family 130 protein n=1 Tax=Belliella kenyensis TaxID=1472724 RepID=A0ABV8EIV7_9BACT|nr:glycoside hydrolase family 130 protein [Belliella kenyensis]MCH7401117.1 glycoside hydrolase family 130 protein [Belliella kenyensis]MDN3604114.1 glycoside hydrolase family 130 protein [Belliella kenyensis]